MRYCYWYIGWFILHPNYWFYECAFIRVYLVISIDRNIKRKNKLSIVRFSFFFIISSIQMDQFLLHSLYAHYSDYYWAFFSFHIQWMRSKFYKLYCWYKKKKNNNINNKIRLNTKYLMDLNILKTISFVCWLFFFHFPGISWFVFFYSSYNFYLLYFIVFFYDWNLFSREFSSVCF